jgi:hypothetical protein
LIKLISDDFTALGEPANFRIVEEGASVASARYGTLHHHDFPRDAISGKIPSISAASGERNCKRLAYLVSRWRNLRQSDFVLFVRRYWSIQEPLLRSVPGAFDDPPLQSLPDALSRSFPDLNYLVLLIDAEERIEHPRLVYRDTKNFQDGDFIQPANLAWQGNHDIFDRLFASLPPMGITPRGEGDREYMRVAAAATLPQGL